MIDIEKRYFAHLDPVKRARARIEKRQPLGLLPILRDARGQYVAARIGDADVADESRLGEAGELKGERAAGMIEGRLHHPRLVDAASLGKDIEIGVERAAVGGKRKGAVRGSGALRVDEADLQVHRLRRDVAQEKFEGVADDLPAEQVRRGISGKIRNGDVFRLATTEKSRNSGIGRGLNSGSHAGEQEQSEDRARRWYFHYHG